MFLLSKKIKRLAAVAKNYHERGGNNFSRCWVPSQVIDKKFKECIVENDADGNHQYIPEQLDMPF